MAYFSRERNCLLRTIPIIPKLSQLSLSKAKGSAGFLALSILLGFSLFWLPSYLQLHDLQKEESSWKLLLKTKVVNNPPKIPTMDELLDITEQCRSIFVNAGVEVVALNIERFGKGDGDKASDGGGIDDALVRLRLRGHRETIISEFKRLEETQEGIRIQEVILGSDGGECLLQIYFYTE